MWTTTLDHTSLETCLPQQDDDDSAVDGRGVWDADWKTLNPKP